jgi:hypothetical protein
MSTTASSSPAPQTSPPWPWSGRKRRNSESSVSSLREFVTGRRNSLSGDGPEPNVLRKKRPESVEPRGRTPAAQDRANPARPAAGGGGGGAKTSVKVDATEKSQSQSR